MFARPDVHCFDLSFAVTAPLDRDKRQVRARLQGSCRFCTQIRLSGGCSGTLEVRTKDGVYATANDVNFGVNEARVVCRQLGRLTNNNAQPVRTYTKK